MRAVLWLISLSLVPSMALETFQFYQARLCQEDTQMCYAMKILVHQTCAKSDTLSVYTSLDTSLLKCHSSTGVFQTFC